MIMHQPRMQPQATINRSEGANSTHAREYTQTQGSREIAVCELIPESPEDDSSSQEDANKYATQYYTTMEPESGESTPQPSPMDSDSAATIVASSGAVETATSHPQNICVPSGGSQREGGASTIKHWTYEEQFKQLYNLSPEPERKEFLDKLFDFMQKKGTPITRVPIMAKQPLDLYKLFKLVVERGGLVEVIKKKAWRNVAKELNLPASITSAAFTMRSQYMKYLYPYECEVEKLSDPQELQMAIDSNKRDRRHSDTVDFMTTPLPTSRGDLESIGTPVTHAGSVTQGLQLISSPTVAIPHGAIPPYSRGFIVTPGGTHIVTPQIASASPQLVQMATHPSGIPIVMPTPTPAKGDVLRVSDDESSEGQEPPSKKIALEMGYSTAATTNVTHIPHTTSFIVTPGSTHMVQASHLSPSTTQLVQMATHQQFPFVIPASGQAIASLESKRGSENSKIDPAARRTLQPQTLSIPVENGLSLAAVTPHSRGGVMVTPTATQVVPASHLGPPHLVQVSPHGPHIPIMIPAIPSQGGVRTADSRTWAGEEQLDTRATHEHAQEDKPAHVTALRMPFANISIQSAGGRDNESSSDASLLVTLELNNVVYQGVLFAKPCSSSPAR